MSDLMITEADVESFRQKMSTWGATLSDAEQAILHMVAVRAFPEANEPEVEGFGQKKADPGTFVFVHHYDKASPVLARFGPGTLDTFIGLRFEPPAAP